VSSVVCLSRASGSERAAAERGGTLREAMRFGGAAGGFVNEVGHERKKRKEERGKERGGEGDLRRRPFFEEK
jgi:hypothetical protein